MKKFNKTLAIAAIATTSMFSAQSVNAQSAFDFNDATNIEMMQATPFGDYDFNVGDTYFAGTNDKESSGFTAYVLKLVKDPKYREAFIALKNLSKITAEDIKTTLGAAGLGYLVIEIIVTLWTRKPFLFHILGL